MCNNTKYTGASRYSLPWISPRNRLYLEQWWFPIHHPSPFSRWTYFLSYFHTQIRLEAWLRIADFRRVFKSSSSWELLPYLGSSPSHHIPSDVAWYPRLLRVSRNLKTSQQNTQQWHFITSICGSLFSVVWSKQRGCTPLNALSPRLYNLP